MLTYKETIKRPRLIIKEDIFPDSPRIDGENLGLFITVDKRHVSPDEHKDFIELVKGTGAVAKNISDHLQLIKDEFPRGDFELEDGTYDKIVYITPMSKYEHGSTVYSRGARFGFDYSNNGFYIILKSSSKEYSDDILTEKDIEEIIDKEIDLYNKYINNEVYEFILYDNKGEQTERSGNIYSIEDIREYLPEEFKNENLQEYIV